MENAFSSYIESFKPVFVPFLYKKNSPVVARHDRNQERRISTMNQNRCESIMNLDTEKNQMLPIEAILLALVGLLECFSKTLDIIETSL